ncbi:MAG TPA: ATP-binding cassette domain-containing protein [Gemmatimonadales bacterium]|nr:ATP-binding cassette domain-containing protein [Gemmatimonadales bacterium]
MTEPEAPLLEFHAIPMPGSAAGMFALSVMRHETVVVVGDENSGVDSLVEFALGLESPAAGTVATFSTDLRTLSRREQLAFRRRLGYLPAGDGLLSNLSLRDNVRLPLRFGSNFKTDEIEGRVDVILAMLRLNRVAQERPAQANEEQRRRAALGRALAFDPELVLLEQPFVGLTDRASAELLEIARGGETGEGGRRTVFITGQDIPMLLRNRVERVVHLADSRHLLTRP